MDKEARLEKIHKSRFNAASRILRIFQMVFYTIDARRDVATFWQDSSKLSFSKNGFL